MGTKRRLGLLVAIAAAISSLAVTPAMAAGRDDASAVEAGHGNTTLEAKAPGDSEPLAGAQLTVDEIPITSLREAITEALAEHPSMEDLDTLEVGYAPFVPHAAEKGRVTTFAYPTGCGQASVVWRNANTIWNQVFTSCDGKSWSDLDYWLRLVRVHPYNNLDTHVVKDSYPDMPAGSSASYDQTFQCRNTNLTAWVGSAEGTMVINGVRYTAKTADDQPATNCGW